MTAPDTLTGKQRRYLRSLGHHRRPVVQVGQGGVSEAVVRATGEALAAHELVKVKFGEGAGGERRDLAARLAQATGAHLVQVLGRTALLYRRHPDAPKITLPPAPRGGTPPSAG